MARLPQGAGAKMTSAGMPGLSAMSGYRRNLHAEDQIEPVSLGLHVAG